MGEDKKAVEFNLPEVDAHPGENVNIPILVKADERLSMVAFSVEYDPRLLELVGPAISPEVESILAGEPGAEWKLDWFADVDAGWIQVSLVVDFQGRDTFALPANELFPVAALDFSVRPEASQGKSALAFTRPGRAAYKSHFHGPQGPLYNSARRHGRPFSQEDEFSDPLDPDLVDGAVIISILGDIGIFVRGDANADRRIDVSDPVTILEFLYVGDTTLSCEDAADANDDGEIDISDPLSVLNYLFLGGTSSAIASSYFVHDETPDSIDCAQY